MPRQNKKTRIKGIPPRLQLQQRDATTGSFPSQVRIASDNRSGNIPVLWNEKNLIEFNTYTLQTSSVAQFQDDLIAYYNFEEAFIRNSLDTSIRFQPALSTFSATGRGFSSPVSASDMHMTFSANTPSGLTYAEFSPSTNNNNSLLGNARSLQFSGETANTESNALNIASIGGSGRSAFDFANNTTPDDFPFTVGCWLYVTKTLDDQVGDSFVYPIATGNPFVTSFWQWSLALDSNFINEFTNPSQGWKVYFTLKDGVFGGTRGAESNGNINVAGFRTNEWVHVMCTYDGSGSAAGTNIYINGLDGDVSASAGGSFTRLRGFSSLTFGGVTTSPSNSTELGATFPGFMDEVIAINRVLSPGEILNLYSSSLKGRFDKPLDGVAYGVGLNVANNFIENSEQLTDIIATGRVVKGVGDEAAHFTPGQDLTPFRDFANPAVEGKSTNEPFYATGSNPLIFGTDLQQPLWSKTKIEIDIGCRTASTLQFYIGETTGNLDYDSNDNDGPPSNDLGWSYPVSYYNFVDKRWEGIGPGYIFPGSINNDGSYIVRDRIDSPIVNDYVFWGFTPSILMYSPTGESTSQTGAPLPIADLRITGQFDFMTTAGQPCTNFGFPYHPKFHATSSQLFNTSTVISEPFLVEKIVVEMSAAFQIFPEMYNTASVIDGGNPPFLNSLISGTLPAAINNLFILNQRTISGLTHDEFNSNLDLGNEGIPIIHARWPMSVSLASTADRGGSPVIETVSTFRDLLGWGGVSSFANNMPDEVVQGSDRGDNGLFFSPDLSKFELNPKTLMTREVVFDSDVDMTDNLTPMSWTGSFKMELVAKHAGRFTRPDPAASPNNNFMMETFIQSNADSFSDFTIGIQYQEGSRNGVGIGLLSGRDRRSSIASLNEQNVLAKGETITFASTDSMSIQNPYLLLPGDQLIVGWHQPIPRVMEPSPDFEDTRNMEERGVFSEITFPEGPAKITIYGSPLREDREEHSTLNQLLTSNTVHEVIE